VRRAALLLGVLALVSVALTNDRSRQDQAAAAFWLGVVALAGPGYALLRGVVAAWQPRHTRLAVGAGVALSLALVLWRSVPGLYRRSHPVPGTFVHPGMDAVAWILANTGPGTAVQASFPNRVAFATDRPAVRLSMSLRPEVHRAIQTRHRPQFAVVLDSIKGDAGASDSARFAVIQRLEPGRWSLVYDFPGGRIYEYR
jgi:hypothetical protein